MPVGPNELEGIVTALERATAATGAGLRAVLAGGLLCEQKAFGLREKVGLANEWAVATDFE
jgi:hypothetical protein